jgi:hypothetical protein
MPYDEQRFGQKGLRGVPIRSDVVARGISHADNEQLMTLMGSPEVANHPEIGPTLVAELKTRGLYRSSDLESSPAVSEKVQVLTQEEINASQTLTDAGAMPGDEIRNNTLIRKASKKDTVGGMREDGVEVLNAKTIRNSDTLLKANALPGDEIIDNKLVRRFSKPGKREVVTQEMIDNSLRLQQLEAKPGDVLEGRALVKADSDSAWKQFLALADDANGNLFNALDSIWINFTDDIVKAWDFNKDIQGWITEKAEEKYGKGFVNASPEERREAIFLQKERELIETYGISFEPRPESTAGALGSLVGALAKDPTTYAPAVAAPKLAAATGALIGTVSSALEDYTRTGQVDMPKAALSGTIGAVIPGGAAKIAQGISQRASAKVIQRVQKVVDEHMKTPGAVVLSHTVPRLAKQAGVSTELFTKALSDIGMKADDLVESATSSAAVKNAVTEDSTVTRFFSKAFDKYLGTLSTQLGNVSNDLKIRLRRFEFDAMNNTKRYANIVAPFSRGLQRLPSQAHREVSRYLNNGNFDAARSVMDRHSASLSNDFDKVLEVLEEIKGELTSPQVGFNFDSIENYFPRSVKNFDGLQQSFGKEEKGIIDKVWAARAKKLGRELSQQEKQDLVNAVVRGYASNFDTPLPSIVKKRTIDNVLDNQLDFYASPEEALNLYIRKAVNHIERRKFFAKNGVINEGEGLDLESSIGKLITNGINKGTIKAQDQDKVKELLTARFVTGETPTGKLQSVIRDTGYMGTIANPLSALVQLGDVATIAALKGLRSTFVSFLGPKAVKMADIMDDQISREFANPGVTSRALDKMFRVSGFKAVDRLGKETAINASLKHNTNLLYSAKGRAKFDSKWGDVFGDELSAVKADLINGDVTDNVKFMLFNELSDMQPISLSEMPTGYLENPKGRILYMLKSFSIKQMDVARNNIIKEWRSGNKATAVKNAVLLGSYLSVANMGISNVKDILQKRELPRAEDVPNEALWSLLGVYGMSKYTSEKYVERGDIKGALANIVLPPLPVAEAAARGTIGAAQGTEESSQLLKLIPVVGGLLYNFFGGGLEKANERSRRERYNG